MTFAPVDGEELGAPVRAFAYHRSVAPLLLVLMALSVVELAVTHLLVAVLWSGQAALLLSLLSVGGIAWLLATLRSFRRLPMLVGTDAALFRLGRIRAVVVRRGQIAATAGEITAAELKRRDLLSLALLAHPNLVVELRGPLRVGRRAVRRMALRVDDPAGLREALA